MVGMIFAAGFGTRLKPWTDAHPKALVPVAGVPALARVIGVMRRAGIERIVVNTHHFADQIQDFLASYGPSVVISHEDPILETGGGLLKALPLIGEEDVLIHNADIMTTVDLADLIRSHYDTDADATLLSGVRRTSRFLLFSPQGRLCGYYRSNEGPVTVDEVSSQTGGGVIPRCFDGVHVFSRRLFSALREYAPAGTPFSIIDFYRCMAPEAKIMRHDLPANRHWFDIGKPETLAKAESFYYELSKDTLTQS